MKANKINISLAAASEEYAALEKKRQELQAQRSELDARLRAVCERLRRGDAHGSPIGSGTAPGRPGVAALLGAFADRLAPTVKGGKDTPNDRVEYAKLEAEIADVDEALRLVATGLRRARIPASERVCAAIGPEYSRRAAALCTAIVETLKLAIEYEELRDALQAEGVAWSTLGPLPEPPFGDPRYAKHELSSYLAAAIETGHLDRRAVPSAVRL